jgi:hypothetical protein
LNTKYIFAAVAAVLLVSLASNLYLYTANRLQNQILDLQSHLASQLATSNEQINNIEKENSNLQQQLDQEREPKPQLVTRLGWYLHPGKLTIYGDVTNIGIKIAENCRLHVTLYRNETIVKDDYIKLGTIEFMNHASLRTDIIFTSSPTNWTITPECD